MSSESFPYEMKSLLNRIRWLWFVALMALFGLSLATISPGMAVSVIAYDGQTQLTTVYDAPSASLIDYDAARKHTADETGNAATANRAFFAYSVEFLAAKTTSGFIDPSKVRFTQDNIGALFRNGQSIDDVARALRGPGGGGLARSFEPIRLVERDGLLWTLDNRRLAAFSAGGQQVPFRMATQAEISAEWARKFTTTAQEGWGQFITVRPPPGFAP